VTATTTTWFMVAHGFDCPFPFISVFFLLDNRSSPEKRMGHASWLTKKTTNTPFT
jgi:hypothetical protein